MESFRKIRFIYVFIFSLIVSSSLIFYMLPRRSKSIRYGSAWIPIRKLTSEEANVLLTTKDSQSQKPYAVIMEVTDEHVTIGTDYFLTTEKRPDAGAIQSVRKYGKTYSIHCASWEYFYNLHQLNKAALEKSLGRRINKNDIDRNHFKDSGVSFSDRCIPLYIVTEIMITTILILFFYYQIIKSKSIWLVLPKITLALFVLLLFVCRFYSPAFLDADLFHQRIIVEDIALLFFHIPFLLQASCISLIVYVLSVVKKSEKVNKHPLYIKFSTLHKKSIP